MLDSIEVRLHAAAVLIPQVAEFEYIYTHTRQKLHFLLYQVFCNYLDFKHFIKIPERRFQVRAVYMAFWKGSSRRFMQSEIFVTEACEADLPAAIRRSLNNRNS